MSNRLPRKIKKRRKKVLDMMLESVLLANCYKFPTKEEFDKMLELLQGGE